MARGRLAYRHTRCKIFGGDDVAATGNAETGRTRSRVTRHSNGGTLEFRLLGPVELWANGTQAPLGPPQQRIVVAGLALEAGRPVSVDGLIDRVWGARPPRRARDAIYGYVAHIRQIFFKAGTSENLPVPLVRRSQGYALDIDPTLVDLHRFHDLVSQARARMNGDRTAALSHALELWRGEPLADLPGEWAERIRQKEGRVRLDAAILWAQSEFCPTKSSLLMEISEEYPLDDSLAVLLMRTLYVAGRNAQALEYYASFRERLAEQLGVDPSAEMQDLHRAILRGEVPQAPPPCRHCTDWGCPYGADTVQDETLASVAPSSASAKTGRRLKESAPGATEPDELSASGAHSLSGLALEVAGLRSAIEAIISSVRQHEEQLRRLGIWGDRV